MGYNEFDLGLKNLTEENQPYNNEIQLQLPQIPDINASESLR